MTRFGISSFFIGLLALAFSQNTLPAQTPGSAPDFQEVYQLIKAHSGLSDAELNRAAVQGFVSALGPKALLVTTEKVAPAAAPQLSKVALFDDNNVYLRVAHVGDGLAKEIGNAYQRINSTNKLSGIVLDLRYTDGRDYAAAVAVAELFIAKSQPLLNWGNGVISAPGTTEAIQLPLAILVNSGTSGSAEALAAMLRASGAGLILGSKTAGLAF
ncbi:MAG: hypothetical protein H7Y43_04140, partial [Akkermansiaceae bacterium]|nr:hypothetical protein [Verrucomicrobiales bacterium]